MSAPTPASLVINCGSSSLKAAWIHPTEEHARGVALAERLGEQGSTVRVELGAKLKEVNRPKMDHGAAFEAIVSGFEALLGRPLNPSVVGHRVVHGGEKFAGPVVVEGRVLEEIRKLGVLAPLHNPVQALGIELAAKRFPTVPQVAVFDTSFHHTLPPVAYRYPLPTRLYREHQVRKYGFHGLSHAYAAEEVARRLGRPVEELELITAHLGNGASATAIAAGKSLDTTMGMTPLEGLMMGTRSGDVDPNLHEFLERTLGWSLSQTTAILNKQSGLLGVSGLSNDMRTLSAAADSGNADAALAIDLYCRRLAKHLLGLTAALSRLDALVFTGGIGENSARIRRQTVEQLRLLKPVLDPELNKTNGATASGRISSAESAFPIWVVAANEERGIALAAYKLLSL